MYVTLRGVHWIHIWLVMTCPWRLVSYRSLDMVKALGLYSLYPLNKFRPRNFIISLLLVYLFHFTAHACTSNFLTFTSLVFHPCMPRRPCWLIVLSRTSNDCLFTISLWYGSLSFLKPLVRSLFPLYVAVLLVIAIRFLFMITPHARRSCTVP